jgi:hypothetical protein|tara:strand:- start:434 stop:649 length:216 start_codon:yes stop_codon:yes gene_type:complete
MKAKKYSTISICQIEHRRLKSISMHLKDKFGFKPTPEQTLSWIINTQYKELGEPSIQNEKLSYISRKGKDE